MWRRYDDDWIEFRDCPTIREYLLIRDGRAVEALSSLITSWSLDLPIRPWTVGQLRWDIADEIIATTLQNYQRVLDDAWKIEGVARQLMRGLRVVERSGYEDLIEFLMPCLGAYGELVCLPEDGGMLDQRLDYMLVLRILQKVRIEMTESEMKTRGW